MKCEINAVGVMKIQTETALEEYALRMWLIEQGDGHPNTEYNLESPIESTTTDIKQ